VEEGERRGLEEGAEGRRDIGSHGTEIVDPHVVVTLEGLRKREEEEKKRGVKMRSEASI